MRWTKGLHAADDVGLLGPVDRGTGGFRADRTVRAAVDCTFTDMF